MQIQARYEESPGSAVAEAVRMYRIGKTCLTTHEIGVSMRQLSVMTGLSIVAIEECMKVAKMYSGDDEFVKAFQDHTMPAGAPYRTWGTFLLSLGVNIINSQEASQVLAHIKSAVQRLAMIAQGSADPEIAQRTLGQMRSWIAGRVPPTVWATIDRNFFLYQRCSFCGGDPNEPELLEHKGLLLTRCTPCKADGADPGAADWKIVAESYAAYASECNHAAEIYRAF